MGGESPSTLLFSLSVCDAMAPACVMDGLLVGPYDLRAPDEVLARTSPPSAGQDLVGLPEFRACGASGLRLPRLAATEADYRFRLAAIRGTSFMAPDPTWPACLVRQSVVGSRLRGPSAQPFLPAQVFGETPHPAGLIQHLPVCFGVGVSEGLFF